MLYTRDVGEPAAQEDCVEVTVLQGISTPHIHACTRQQQVNKCRVYAGVDATQRRHADLSGWPAVPGSGPAGRRHNTLYQPSSPLEPKQEGRQANRPCCEHHPLCCVPLVSSRLSPLTSAPRRLLGAVQRGWPDELPPLPLSLPTSKQTELTGGREEVHVVWPGFTDCSSCTRYHTSSPTCYAPAACGRWRQPAAPGPSQRREPLSPALSQMRGACRAVGPLPVRAGWLHRAATKLDSTPQPGAARRGACNPPSSGTFTTNFPAAALPACPLAVTKTKPLAYILGGKGALLALPSRLHCRAASPPAPLPATIPTATCPHAVPPWPGCGRNTAISLRLACRLPAGVQPA